MPKCLQVFSGSTDLGRARLGSSASCWMWTGIGSSLLPVSSFWCPGWCGQWLPGACSPGRPLECKRSKPNTQTLLSLLLKSHSSIFHGQIQLRGQAHDQLGSAVYSTHSGRERRVSICWTRMQTIIAFFIYCNTFFPSKHAASTQ